MTSISLPWTTAPITQNGLRRMHHYAEAKAKSAALEQARRAIRRDKVKPRAGAIVILNWQMSDRRRRDGDGAAPTLKVVLDALVAEGVLPDDSWVHVPHSGITTHPPVKGLPGSMWVTLTDPDHIDSARAAKETT
jgi:crossover junction endodeoxyribonuclease RusA